MKANVFLVTVFLVSGVLIFTFPLRGQAQGQAQGKFQVQSRFSSSSSQVGSPAEPFRFSDFLPQVSPGQVLANWEKAGKGMKGDGARLRVQMKRELERVQKFKKARHFKWVRGEIEDEKVVTGLVTLIQIELWDLENRKLRPQELQQEWAGIFRFASELAYEEATPVGLKLAHALRAFVFDAIARQEVRNPQQFSSADWISWVQGLPTPWPVDRMVLSEAQKHLNERSKRHLPLLISEIQKNSYRSLEQILIHTGLNDVESLVALKNLWRPEDIQLMREELVRRGRIPIRWSAQLYQRTQGKAPVSVEDLIKAGILFQVPLNYQTGKPFLLAEALVAE